MFSYLLFKYLILLTSRVAYREGILFAMSDCDDLQPGSPPPNIAFLDILTEFTSKLIKQDKRAVSSFLDKKLPPGVPAKLDASTDVWLPLLTYRNCLAQGADGEAAIRAPTSPMRGRPKADTPGRRRAAEMLTSTAIKQRRMTEEMSELGSEADQDL